MSGLGTRRLADDPRFGAVEILDLIPCLSTIAAERAVRTRANALRDSGTARAGAPILPVLEVRRVHDHLSVVSPDPDGVRVYDLLVALDTGTLSLNEAAIIDLAMAIVRAVAWLHERPGGFAHGALSIDHIALGRDGAMALTDAVFAPALQTLAWNRERFWRECGLTLPVAATPPQFDQRVDVVELGGVVLAVLLRRPLRVDEFSAIADLVSTVAQRYPAGLALRGWLRQALHLHPKLAFVSAVEALPAFASAVAEGGRAPAKRNLLRQVMANLAG